MFKFIVDGYYLHRLNLPLASSQTITAFTVKLRHHIRPYAKFTFPMCYIL